MQDSQSFQRSVVVALALGAAAFVIALINQIDKITLTALGHLAYLLLFLIVTLSWRQFSAAVQRHDLAASCISGIAFVLIVRSLLEYIVGGAFVRGAVYANFNFPSEWQRIGPPIVQALQWDIPVVMTVCVACVIWKLRVAYRTQDNLVGAGR